MGDDSANTAATIAQRTAADVLFGPEPGNGHDRGETRTTEPGPRTLAERLFGDAESAARAQAATAKPVEPRRKTAAELLFGEHAADYLHLDDNIKRLADREGLSVEQQNAERRDFADLAVNELGLANTDAQRLHDIVTEARLKGDTEDWPAQTERWLQQSRTQLRERYGAEEAEALVHQLDAYAEAHPRLKKFLENGVGRHPRVVSMFVERVQRIGR